MALIIGPKGPIGCVLVMSVLASASALAQTSSDQDLLSLNIEELTHVTVYGASRHLQDAREAPSSVTVITAEDIYRYGWQTLGEVMRSVRGFYTSYDRQYTYLGARGFQRPGDYNSRILLLINGHRFNDNVYDTAWMGTEFPLDLDLIDHIEVVRGPGSSLFGRNAIFGVINIVTRKATDRPYIEVSGALSSYLNRTGRITGSATHGPLAAIVSGSLGRSAGPSPLFYPEFNSPTTNDGLAVNLDGESRGDFFADVRYGNFRVQGLYGSRLKVIPAASYATNFNDPGTRVTDTDGYLDFGYQRSLGKKTDLEVRAYYDHYRYYGTYAYGGTDSPGRYLNLDGSVADWAGLETTLNHEIGRLHFTLGANYEYNFRIDQENNDQGQPPVLKDHRTPWLAASYAEAALKLSPKLTLHAGARFDYFSQYGAAVSPRTALVYMPGSHTALKYIFGRAFRAPNAYESYYSYDADGISRPRPPSPLQKENIQSHEVVFEHDWNSWFATTIDAYYDNLDQLIDWTTDPNTSFVEALNVGRARGRGIEVGLDVRRPSGLEARASYGLADAYDEVTRDRLDNAPLHQAKLNGSVPIGKGVFAGMELLYTGPQQTLTETRIGSSFLTNATFSTKPLWGGWEFSASCYNVFDRTWFAPAGLEYTQTAIEQDGRGFRFKISYHLGGERTGRGR